MRRTVAAPNSNRPYQRCFWSLIIRERAEDPEKCYIPTMVERVAGQVVLSNRDLRPTGVNGEGNVSVRWRNEELFA